jgi:predicted small lipoprotein YifL
MRNSFKCCAALLLVASLLGGCGPIYIHKYTPPAKLTDVNCLNTCTREVNSCTYLRLQQHKHDEVIYESEVQSYERCQVGRSDKEVYKDCKSPQYPQNSEKYTCELDYDSCYQACGGTIERVPLF